MTAGDQIHVVQFGHLRRPGAQVSVFERIQAAFHLHAAAQGGADFFAGFAEITHGFEIVIANALALLEFEPVVNVGNDGGLFGETEHIGAQTEDARGDVLVCAVDEADYGNDRGDTDNHADQRQDTAQLVCPETGGGDRHSLGQIHGGRTRHRTRGHKHTSS